MKTLTLFFVAALAVWAQNPPATGLQPVSSPTPGGACTNSQPAFYSTADQKLYTCLAGIWSLPPSSGGPPTGAGNGGAIAPGSTYPNNLNIANNTIYAQNQSGATPDVQITNAIAALPSAGGTVDASGITGAQNWAACPTWGTKPITLITGVGTITSNATSCTIPINVKWEPVNGSLLTVATGNTLTINAEPSAAINQQIFPSTIAGALRLSAPTYVGWFGAVSDSSTDNTNPLNTAFSSAAPGASIHIPCGQNYYLISGQIKMTSAHTYWGDNSADRYANCRLNSTYSGNDAAFLFVGAEDVSLVNLYFEDGNSQSPPYTVATFGSTSGTSRNGSVYSFHDVSIAGYSRIATAYAISSESWSAFNLGVLNSGGGAIYAFATSDHDELNGCPSCYTGSLSNTALHFFGGGFGDYNSTGSTHAALYVSGAGTGDIGFSGGNITAPGDGGATAYGYCVQVNGPISGPISVNQQRCENGSVFWKFTGTSVNQIQSYGNNLVVSGSGSNYFIDSVALSGNVSQSNFIGDRVSSGQTLNITNITNSVIMEPFASTFSSGFTNSFFTANGSTQLDNLVIGTGSTAGTNTIQIANGTCSTVANQASLCSVGGVLNIQANVASASSVSAIFGNLATGSTGSRIILENASDTGTAPNRGLVAGVAGSLSFFADYEARPMQFFTGSSAGSVSLRGEFDKNGLFSIGSSSTATSNPFYVNSGTIHSGISGTAGCLALYDTVATTTLYYITVVSGVVTASSTKPSNCN